MDQITQDPPRKITKAVAAKVAKGDQEQMAEERMADIPDSKVIKDILKKSGSPAFILDPSIEQELVRTRVATKNLKDKEERFIPQAIHSHSDLQELVSLFETCQAYRDRVTDILTGLLPVRRELKILIRMAEEYIYRNYRREMSTLKTENMRSLKVTESIRPLQDKFDRVRTMIELAEIVKQNLTDTYFTLREIAHIGIEVMAQSRFDDGATKLRNIAQ